VDEFAIVMLVPSLAFLLRADYVIVAAKINSAIIFRPI
jgi:hypothetical protein